MAKRVTTIPATLNRFDSRPLQSVRKRRVAGYARVSTDSEEQATSYDTTSKQIMTRFQNRLKAKRLRENYSRASSEHWKSRGL